MYLEVPGISGNGPDKENIDRVRKLFRWNNYVVIV